MTETIKCPECGQVQEAKVLPTALFAILVHRCERCGYMITDSTWEKVKERTKAVNMTCNHDKITNATLSELTNVVTLAHVTCSCLELMEAMREYEFDVDCDAPQSHREMMKRARKAIEDAKEQLNKLQLGDRNE